MQNGSESALVRSDLTDLPLSTWWQEGRVLPDAKGRGRVVVLEPGDGLTAVARTYRRGGALRGVLGDRYLGPGRAFRELIVLAGLAARRIPAVEPLAAVARRRGGFFRLRLVTTLVRDARPLSDFLGAHPDLRRRAVEEAGRVVQTAFDAGLHHRDLHPDNLLAVQAPDGARVLLMDLDRAHLESAVEEREQERMLVRMARYLHRHRGHLAVCPSATDHLRFLRGTGMDRRARRRVVNRLAPVIKRSVAWHRLSWREK